MAGVERPRSSPCSPPRRPRRLIDVLPAPEVERLSKAAKDLALEPIAPLPRPKTKTRLSKKSRGAVTVPLPPRSQSCTSQTSQTRANQRATRPLALSVNCCRQGSLPPSRESHSARGTPCIGHAKRARSASANVDTARAESSASGRGASVIGRASSRMGTPRPLHPPRISKQYPALSPSSDCPDDQCSLSIGLHSSTASVPEPVSALMQQRHASKREASPIASDMTQLSQPFAESPDSVSKQAELEFNRILGRIRPSTSPAVMRQSRPATVSSYVGKETMPAQWEMASIQTEESALDMGANMNDFSILLSSVAVSEHLTSCHHSESLAPKETKGRSVSIRRCSLKEVDLSRWEPVPTPVPKATDEMRYISHVRTQFPGVLEYTDEAQQRHAVVVGSSRAPVWL